MRNIEFVPKAFKEYQDWIEKDRKTALRIGDLIKDILRSSFEGMGKPSTGAFLLEAQAQGTKITWTMQGSSEGNFMMKLFAPFMDKMVGPDFEAGLDNLKKLAEKNFEQN